jgi:thiamine pyrophosphate-dependent acetolactate synthase large subunit-like protein
VESPTGIAATVHDAIDETGPVVVDVPIRD